MNDTQTLRERALAARHALRSLCEAIQLPAPGRPADERLRTITDLAQRLLSALGPLPGGDAPARPSSQSEQSARVYFDYALTGILETDRQGQVRRANPASASITGHDVKVLCGAELGSLVSEASSARLQRHLARLDEQGISQVELRMVRSDGREIVVEIGSIQVDDDHFIHVFDDVTEQREALAQIERARASAEAANRAKSDFLANVSHEIRTPLNGIIGLSELLLRTDLDGQQRNYLDMIRQSGKTLLHLVDDLLDTAKLESHRMQFERSPYCLDALLAELDILRAQASGKPVDVNFNVAPEVPRHLVGDRLRLGQCLRNLLSNAIKFTPQGRIDLNVDVMRSHQVPQLRFCVVDTGIGIAQDAIARLFSPFSQADASTTRRYGGTGLGLYIARELAAGMGGNLTLDSVVGKGSRLTLTLPLVTAGAELPEQHDDLPADVPQEFRGTTLLLVEDDATNRLVAKDWLTQAGIRALVAENGREALGCIAHAERTGALPALILMDVQMPDMDGVQATRELRSRGCTLPIVGLSAGASVAERSTCLEAGMNDFLAKPLDIDELWGCLTRWLPPTTPGSAGVAAESVETRFLNDGAVLAKARSAFSASHRADGARLLALVRAGDPRGAAQLAHALKGSAATLGLDLVASLAGDLERALQGPALGNTAELLCRGIEEQLTRAIAEFGSSGGSEPAGD